MPAGERYGRAGVSACHKKGGPLCPPSLKFSSPSPAMVYQGRGFFCCSDHAGGDKPRPYDSCIEFFKCRGGVYPRPKMKSPVGAAFQPRLISSSRAGVSACQSIDTKEQAQRPAPPKNPEFRQVNRRGGVYPRPPKVDQQTSIQHRVGRASLPANRQAQRPVPPGLASSRKHIAGRAGVSACQSIDTKEQAQRPALPNKA